MYCIYWIWRPHFSMTVFISIFIVFIIHYYCYTYLFICSFIICYLFRCAMTIFSYDHSGPPQRTVTLLTLS